MVELEAEATGALHDGPPEAPVRKKEYIVLAEHEHWDYLKGSGPSAPPRVQTEPHENKRGFKPGWKSVRPMAKIDPHRPSYETEDRREERADKHMPNRRQYLNTRDKQSGYNPITGQPYAGLVQQPELQRGLKAVPARVPEAENTVQRRLAGAEYRAQLRAHRIANCGLDPAKVVNSVVDNFEPVL